MATVDHGGSAKPVFAAANVLADMSASLTTESALEMIEDGLLDVCTKAFLNEADPSEESRPVQGRTLFQLLRVLQNLVAFPKAADAVCNYNGRQLVQALVKSGFSIERGSADTWVPPFGNIFDAIFESELRASKSNTYPVIEVPDLCRLLSTRIIPYLDHTNSRMGDSLILLLDSYFSSIGKSADDKKLYLSEVHSKGTLSSHTNEGNSEASDRGEQEESFGSSIISLALATTNAYNMTRQPQEKSTAVFKSLLSTLKSVASLLVLEEEELLRNLETVQLEHKPATILSDGENSEVEPILYVVDYYPWYQYIKVDRRNEKIFEKREKILGDFRTLIGALPSSVNDSSSVSELLKTLMLVTSSLDTDLLYEISKKGNWLSDLMMSWIIVDPSKKAIKANLEHSSTDKDRAGNVVNEKLATDLESWETCPLQRPQLEGLTPRSAEHIRKRSIELLSRLSIIPDVASQISITRCLCGVQLEHGQIFNLDKDHLSPGESKERDEEELEVALRSVAQIRPIHKIVTNVSRYAPTHVSALHLERLITMNPSEMESLILLSNVTAEPHISQITLSDPLLSHFAFSRIASASKNITYHYSPQRRGKKRQTSAEPLPFAEDEYLHFTTRLAIQTVSNLAKTNPKATLDKLTADKSLSFLQRCVASSDQSLKGLSVLTFAHLASSIAEKEEQAALNSKGRRVPPTIDPQLLEGVQILYPSSKPRRSSDSHADSLHPKYELISNEEFDIVFIHGINGHPVTTWRVENPTINSPSKWPRTAGQKTKELVGETYRAYMRSLSDPEGAMMEAEAEQAICWPRDWLPHYLPRSRVITVSYDIALTKWSSRETIPLKLQAASILTKLRLLGVGEKPVIFVVHSFGGLITKEMLQECSKMQEYSDVLRNTRGILFFSTPHRGSTLAGFANGAPDLLFRGSSAVTELYPSNWYLHHLNDAFPRFAPHVPTLSIGEIETCFLQSLGPSLSTIGADKYTCYEIVPDESSNPAWKGDNHSFVKLHHNHREVCKPINSADQRFQIVVDFFKKYAPRETTL